MTESNLSQLSICLVTLSVLPLVHRINKKIVCLSFTNMFFNGSYLPAMTNIKQSRDCLPEAVASSADAVAFAERMRKHADLRIHTGDNTLDGKQHAIVSF